MNTYLHIHLQLCVFIHLQTKYKITKKVFGKTYIDRQKGYKIIKYINKLNIQITDT